MAPHDDETIGSASGWLRPSGKAILEIDDWTRLLGVGDELLELGDGLGLEACFDDAAVPVE